MRRKLAKKSRVPPLAGIPARKGAKYRVIVGDNYTHILNARTRKSFCMAEVTKERQYCRDYVVNPPGKEVCPSCIRVLDARRKQERSKRRSPSVGISIQKTSRTTMTHKRKPVPYSSRGKTDNALIEAIANAENLLDGKPATGERDLDSTLKMLQARLDRLKIGDQL